MRSFGGCKPMKEVCSCWKFMPGNIFRAGR
nr:MAG TPA: hypothetical protein [Caudoviricetes sp.]